MSKLTTSDTPARSGLGLILCAATLWGTVGTTTQALYGLSSTNALSIGFFRLAIAALILLVACTWMLRQRILKIKRKDALVMALMGTLLALYRACYFAAISYCGVAVAALITLCTAPVIVAIVSLTITHERMTATITAALVCSVGGTGLLLLYLGSIPTALAYGLFIVGIRSTPATITSIVTLIEPLTSALLAWVIFGERLGAIGLLGALLLLSAILLLAKRR